MTSQHFLEIAAFCEGVKGFLKYAEQQNYTYEIIAKNPLKDINSLNLKYFDNKNIQKNNDFIMNINFELYKKLLPSDVKLIGNALNSLPLTNGNISIVPKYDLFTHVNRLKGILSMIPNTNDIIYKLDHILKDYKNKKKSISDLHKIFQNLLYDILLDPNYSNIFPSLIVEAPVLDEVDDFENNQQFNIDLRKNLETKEVFPESFFLPMGLEKPNDYLLYREQILKTMPSTHVTNILENFESFKILC